MKLQNRFWLVITSVLAASVLITGCGPKTTKAEWKAKLGRKNQMFQVTGGVIQMQKNTFVKLMGSPDKTQTLNGQVYWYYSCKDGMIQVVVDAGALSQGVMAGHANDY